MKSTNSFTTKMGVRLLFLSLSLFFFTIKVSGQTDSTGIGGSDSTHHFPPSPHHHHRLPIDTTGWSGDTTWHFTPPAPGDSIWAGDTAHHRPPIDTIGWGGDTIWHFSPPPPGDSTGWAGGDTTHHRRPPIDTTGWGGDTTWHFPPAPPGDSGWAGDSIPAPPPGDSTGWTGGDSTGHHNPPPPPGDSTGWTGGDSIPTPPPGDSTGGWGGGDSTGTCGGDSTGHGRPGIDINSGGITGPSTAVMVAIYPNPVSSTADLNIQNTNGTVTFRLFDGAGRTVMIKTNLTNGSMQFNREDLAPGLYFYEVDDNNTKTSGRIVLQ